MTLEELYKQIGGDYEDVMKRLCSDALAERLIVKFIDDDSSSRLQEAWSCGDEAAAFQAAHAAKGVCANLSITSLAQLASQITEVLRPGNDHMRAQVDADALVKQYGQTHDQVAAAIAAFAQEKNT